MGGNGNSSAALRPKPSARATRGFIDCVSSASPSNCDEEDATRDCCTRCGRSFIDTPRRSATALTFTTEPSPATVSATGLLLRFRSAIRPLVELSTVRCTVPPGASPSYRIGLSRRFTKMNSQYEPAISVRHLPNSTVRRTGSRSCRRTGAVRRLQLRTAHHGDGNHGARRREWPPAGDWPT